MDDQELVERIKNGEVWAFEKLVRKYQAKLIAFAKRIVRDPKTAEEVVQDAFVKTYLAIDRIEAERKFSSFLYEVAKNTAISQLRKEKYELPLVEEMLVGENKSRIEEIASEEERENIRQLVAKLPAKYREALTCYYFREMSYEETSKRLQIPINTVRTNLKRGKEQLKKLMTPNYAR